MSANKDGVMVILSSPSGAGKTTLVKKISNLRNFKISISYTTRVPRANEVNGKDYFFINQNDFRNLINKDELLEHAKVFNNYYGTSKKKVFDLITNGKNVIFDIDWQGANQIKQKKLKYKLITFFIVPPSKKTLIKRLSERENKNASVVEERMNNFKKDISHWNEYDYILINDNLEICTSEILKLIDAELKNIKTEINRNKIKEHIQKLII